MIIKEAEGFIPQIDPTARGAENIVVTGDVTVDADATLWYGCVLRGDVAPIRIGRGSNVQDNSVAHCSADHPVVVGNNVVIGHGAILHGCTVEDGSLIGMGATVLNGGKDYSPWKSCDGRPRQGGAAPHRRRAGGDAAQRRTLRRGRKTSAPSHQ